MTNAGGPRNEPTSYPLQPPQAPPAQPEPARSAPARSAPAQRTPDQPDPARPSPAQGSAPQPEGAGRLVGGRYRLLNRLGHGGMGTVWHARDTVVEREVAIKEPRLPDHLSEAERATAYERMQREARAAARIDHPCVVTVHDVVVEEGRPWVVMELVRGQSLADRLHEGTLDPREAARIGAAVAGALQAAHDAGVLHRDVKPDNVLLGRAGRVVLTDFGIAQVEGEQRLTETGVFVGSPEFISPERVLGQRPGPAADLWSLGVVLYAAVEGMSPFRRSNTPATLQAVLSAEPQAPARAGGALALLVMQLLRKDPMARPPAPEVRQVLQGLAHPAAPDTRPLPPHHGRADRWVPPVLRDNRRAQLGLGAGVLVVALALVLLLLDPLKGNELPSGWEVRPERETVAASLAVPSDYRRVPDDGSIAGVTFDDPSDVFHVYLTRVDNAAVDDPVQPTGAAWAKYYKQGGDNGTEFTPVKVSGSTTSYRGKRAYETTVTFTDYADSSDHPVRHYRHQLLVPEGGTSTWYWRLAVDMPADGWAHPVGERLYRDIVAHLDLDT